MNVKKILIKIVLIPIIVFLLIFVCPWFALWFGLAIMPNPPKPVIKYGEFPYQLTYELDGEIITIEDVAICEFDGYKPRTEAGQGRKWKIYSKSEAGTSSLYNEQGEKTDALWITLADLRDRNILDDSGNEVLELYFYGGNGHYYMDDELGSYDRNAQALTEIDYMYKTVDGKIRHSSFKAEKAYEMFKIRLISWEAAEPIQNSFKYLNFKYLK